MVRMDALLKINVHKRSCRVSFEFVHTCDLVQLLCTALIAPNPYGNLQLITDYMMLMM